MSKRFAAGCLTLLIAAAISPASSFAQAFLYRDGSRVGVGGPIYDGTADTNFREGAPTTSFAEFPTVIADQFDTRGFLSQGAIRFDGLETGPLAESLAAGGVVAHAELALWVVDPTSQAASIDFRRIAGPDQQAGRPWREDNVWFDLTPNGGDCINLCFPLLAIGGFFGEEEVAAEIDFSPGFVGGDPTRGPDPVYLASVDSEDLLEDALARGEQRSQAIADSFFRFDATDTATAWLHGDAPNLGWVIDSSSSNGWGFFSSDLAFDSQGLWLPESLGGRADSFSPTETAGLSIRAQELRPALTIVTHTSAGPADIDFDGNVDADDYDLMTQRLAADVDGALVAGEAGDLDFDRDIDLDDFHLFKAAFSVAAIAVPEPGASLLLAIAFAPFVRPWA